MRIFLVNNLGGGFADHVEIVNDITVGQLFGQQMQDERPEDYLIRVNRQVVHEDHVLKEGDRVTFTPVRIEGAN